MKIALLFLLVCVAAATAAENVELPTDEEVLDFLDSFPQEDINELPQDASYDADNEKDKFFGALIGAAAKIGLRAGARIAARAAGRAAARAVGRYAGRSAGRLAGRIVKRYGKRAVKRAGRKAINEATQRRRTDTRRRRWRW